MGGPSNSGGGGGGNNKTYSSSREIGLMNQYKKPKKRAADTKKMKSEAFREQGAYNTRRNLDKLPSFGPTTAILKGLSPILQKNSKRTRDFFTDKVLTDPRGKKNFGYTKDEFEKLSMAKQNKIYSNYITTRRDNKTDGYGTVFREGNDNNDRPNLKIGKPTQPDEGEVSEPSEPIYGDDATLTDEEIALRNKRKGRKRTVLTSVTGDTSEATLSKKTLLGG